MTRLLSASLSLLLIVVVGAAQAPAAQGSAAEPNIRIGDRFANGIAAQVEDRIITVSDIRRRVEPLLPQILASSRTEAEFMRNLQSVEDEIIQSLVDEVLIVKDFYSDEKRRIPPNIIDNELDERIITEFDNDRTKFLAFLRAIGKNKHEFRREIEEEIIQSWMRSQKRKSQAIVSPVRIENYYTENRDQFYQGDGVHLRMIRLSRIADESDAVLQQTADTIMRELRNGRDFGALAQQYSQDPTKRRGGDAGWFAKDDLREELTTAAFALEKGQFSEPLTIDRDIFILYVEDKRVAGIQPLEDVRDQIEQNLIQQMARESQERWLERLRRNAYVRYF